MHFAVADGPNHSPGYFPHEDAPYSTNLWIENGASGSSANRDSSLASPPGLNPRLQSTSALATQLCQRVYEG